MGDLLNSQKNSYDDNGSLIINNTTLIESGILTVSYGGTTSLGRSLPAMYDSDPATECNLQTGASTGTMTWDMKTKIKWKNIYCAYHTWGSDLTTFSLQGSNNNVDWTTLSNGTNQTTDYTRTLLASNVTYRYIRVTSTGSGGASTYFR